MALFPAYAQPQNVTEMDVVEGTPPDPSEVVSPRRETLLLASDSDLDEERPARPALSRRSSHNEHFYWDTKSDYGNLRVSTLYYPGRPQYDLSAKPWLCGGGAGAGAKRRAARRYYDAPPADAPAHDELHERTAAFRRMLADQPADAALWLRYIDFQEQWCGGESALRAAEEAAAAARAPALLAERQRLRAAHLPRDAYLATLRDDLANAQRSSSSDEVLSAWVRLLGALGAAATRAPPLAAAALQRLPHAAYPHLLYVHGATLRAAGLWEQLVLLMELVAAMNFPPAGFPPPHDEERARAADAALLDAEDKVVRSGLPLSAVWVRVERARAAAHWRPALAREADPQRRPLPADVADLLLPVADDDAAFLLCVNLLRLAKVPLLPATEYLSRACGPAGLAEEEVQGAWASGAAEALLPLLRAARRLPPAHPARPHPCHARDLLHHLLDPPHYFTDDHGFLSWVSALWEACCAWTAGARRVALLCWRLRWLHALLLLLDPREPAQQAEARRIRGEARAALKRHAGDSPLPYAQFARIEREVAGEARGAAAAERALRAALADGECEATLRLHVARLAREAGGAAAAWAVPCAVLGRALPSERELQERPRPDECMLRAALQHCEERCGELEARFAAGGGAGARSACAALLPGAAEWAGARAALASPARLAQLLRDLPQQFDAARDSVEGSRYYEQSACALVLARDHRLAAAAHHLAHLFPHNALLALASAGTPLWARQRGAAAELRVAELAQPARTHTAALALALPALLRAAAGGWDARGAERVRAACARAARRGCGGALLAAAALEGAARGERAGAAPRALLAALDLHPDHKWLYVRGAAWVCAEAEALGDVVLERQLRLHALRDELAAAAPHH